MKESKVMKVVLVIIIAFSILLVAKETFAETDLTNTLTVNNTTNNSVLTITGNNTTNNTTNNTLNNTTNNVLKTNNTSNYNNTALPKTGVADSVPGVILVVVLGISSVYAYKKIQYYKNI